MRPDSHLFVSKELRTIQFVEHGHECFVVDYTAQTVPGVWRLGATLQEVARASEPALTSLP